MFDLDLPKTLDTLKTTSQDYRLEEHHLCDLLAGHPTTVQTFAPLLQNKSLADVYLQMLRMLRNKQLLEHVSNPMDSLKVTLDASVQHVRSFEPQAIDLFCLIGMLPAGATEQELLELWTGQGKDIYHLLQVLLKYSLIVDKTVGERVEYTLSVPIFNVYAVSLLNRYQYREFNSKIVDFFVKSYENDTTSKI